MLEASSVKTGPDGARSSFFFQRTSASWVFSCLRANDNVDAHTFLGNLAADDSHTCVCAGVHSGG